MTVDIFNYSFTEQRLKLIGTISFKITLSSQTQKCKQCLNFENVLFGAQR